MTRAKKAGCAVSALLAFLVLIALLGDPWMLEVTFHLAAGWIAFLGKVLPRVSVDFGGVLLLVVLLALAGGLGHSLSRWLWKNSGHEGPWRPRWTISGLGILVVMFAAGMAVTGVAHQTGWLLRSPEPLLIHHGRASNDRNASASLKTIATAQADFRSNDRDGNHINDYWREDIAGLYTIVPEGGRSPENMIKLIELSVAGADDRAVKSAAALTPRQPKAGYWYHALKFRGETDPSPDHFAACAIPSSPSAGKYYYIISDDNVLFRKSTAVGPPPEVYPDDPLKEGWERMD